MREKKKVVIIGAGFAGLKALKILKREKILDITLLSDKENFEFTPSLHLALNNPNYIKEITFPLVKYFGKYFKKEIVTKINQNSIETKSGNIYDFDYCIVSNGARTNYFGNDTMINICPPIKTITDVNNINSKLPKAKTITVIGGGYVGVEVATALAEKTKDKKIIIVQAAERLIPNMNENVSNTLLNYCKKKNIEVIFNDKVVSGDNTIIKLESGKTLENDISIWATGIKPNTEIVGHELKLSDIQSDQQYENIYYAGDVAPTGTIATGHVALVEGKNAARAILSKINNARVNLHKPKKNQMLVIALGHHDGIWTIGKHGIYIPFISGLAKMVVERTILWELKH